MSETQEIMFADDPMPAPERKVNKERFDWYEAYCKGKYSMPDDWQIYRWEAKGEHGNPGCFVLVEGAIFKQIVSKGKRKGRIDYKKPEPGSTATLSILITDLDRFKVEWSAKTGKCHECYGTGQEFWKWDHKEGVSYRNCHACRATGKTA